MSLNDEIAALVKKPRYDFADLACVMKLLRSEVGCPWDREQDHHSIRKSLIEETYEVVEAIDTENPELLREELGDLLFQVMFHAELERERGAFTVDDVVDEICKKMIHRHPHVFGTVEVADSREVLTNWEAIKTEEKQRNTVLDKLRAVPPMMPALMRASKVSKKAGETDGVNATDVLCRLEAQLNAAKAALEKGDLAAEEAVGGLLMHSVNLANLLGVDAEYALTRQVERLIEQFAQKIAKIIAVFTIFFQKVEQKYLSSWKKYDRIYPATPIHIFMEDFSND